MSINESGSLSLLQDGENVSALLLFLRLGFFSSGFLDLLLTEFNIILLKIPLSEWGSVDLDN